MLFLSVRKTYHQVFCKLDFTVRSHNGSCGASFNNPFFNKRTELNNENNLV